MFQPRRLAVFLSLLAVLVAAPAALRALPQEPAQDEPPPAVADSFQEVFFAVLEGLYKDGVSDEAVDGLLVVNDAGGNALFVPGCGICLPVLNALRAYRARTGVTGYKVEFDTFGPGLRQDVAAACTSADVAVRFNALGALVERWVAERLERRRLTPEERARFNLEMQDLRKQGMAGLTAQKVRGVPIGFKTCASCDAANAARGD